MKRKRKVDRRKMGKDNVTKWDFCSSLLMTKDGPILYYDWCCKEANRLNKDGRTVKVDLKDKARFCAVIEK